jgi:hypothetical protein
VSSPAASIISSGSVTGDTGGPDDTPRRRETVELRLAIELLPQHAALRASGPRARVYVDALHRRQVDHHSVVDSGPPADVVAAAPDGDLEAEAPGQPHRVGHVGSPLATHDEGRALVDQPVMNAPGLVVPGVRGLQQLSREVRRELLNVR